MKLNKGVFLLHAVPIMLLALEPGANAAFILDITQSGPDVLGTGSGTLDLVSLSAGGPGVGGFEIWGTYPEGGSAIGLGPYPAMTVGYFFGSALPGATMTFGVGGLMSESSGNGDQVDIVPALGMICVPFGYTSGAVLSDTSTWSGETIAALGLIPGTYTYNWGTGSTADSFTINISAAGTPEPSSFWSFALVASALFFRGLRRFLSKNANALGRARRLGSGLVR
jgi:hypothetical protein